MKTTGLNFIEAVQAADGGIMKCRDTYFQQAQNGNVHEVDMKTGGWNGVAIDHYAVSLLTDNNWEIVPDPPKTMTFQEAVEALDIGCKGIRRLSWDSSRYLETNITLITDNNGKEYRIVRQDVLATDWVIVEEGQS